jgi:hypothetical protein
LFLTITAPLSISPPDLGNQRAIQVFQVLVTLSSISSVFCILVSTLWVDFFNLGAPAPSDVHWFDSLGFTNDIFLYL